nr:external alternative NAD(P)H-ubiquinone oxidoreductase B2, mitochondrial-like [Tanacetum cinerariifolium]
MSMKLYERCSRTFRDNPTLSRFLVVFAVSGGGLVAYSEANVHSGAKIDALPEAGNEKKRVVVLGTGWAGISFLKNLKNPSYDVQVISPRNYFAFTPLLPSVTVGTVEARSVVEPIRNIVKKKNVNVNYWEAECYRIDAKSKKVYCRASQDDKEEFVVDYDYLVVAMGARVNTFNTPGVEENCHYLKEVEDAQKIRRTVIDCFEKACLPNLSEEERKRALQFVVVGGGPTGVEFAAELHDFVSEDLVKLYPSVKDLVKITLLEATDHILNMFDKRITIFAEEKFHRDGIDLRTGEMVTKVTDKEISTKIIKTGETSTIPYGMAVWSTGIATRPVVMDFMKQIGQANRRVLATDEWLRVEGTNSIYALGDCATINQRKVMEDISAIFQKADKDNSGTLTVKEFQEALDDICDRYPQMQLYLNSKQMSSLVDILKESKGDVAKESVELNVEQFKSALSQVDSQMKNLPATAQVAAQQGSYLADCFNRLEECTKNPEGPIRFRESGRHRFRPFRYKHLGQFAPLGGEQTAAQLPGDWVSIGHSSQWLWYSVYASKQVSWRTRKFKKLGTPIESQTHHCQGTASDQDVGQLLARKVYPSKWPPAMLLLKWLPIIVPSRGPTTKNVDHCHERAEIKKSSTASCCHRGGHKSFIVVQGYDCYFIVQRSQWLFVLRDLAQSFVIVQGHDCFGVVFLLLAFYPQAWLSPPPNVPGKLGANAIVSNPSTNPNPIFAFHASSFITPSSTVGPTPTYLPGMGDLYPVTAPSPIPHAFLVSQHTWHQRLGHPGGEVLCHRASSNFISYNKEKPLVLCHAFQLGKHVRLSFISSSTVILLVLTLFTRMCELYSF